MGALLGKVTFPQLMVIVTIEAIFYTLNCVICVDLLHVHDLSGSMVIHIFGAYFGLTASMFFNPKKAIEDRLKQNKGGHFSDMVGMIGVVFLFMYWSSFNAVFADGEQRMRAVGNTFASLTASVLVAVYVSRAVKGKIDMEVTMNASLAGGVCMGACCDIITNPGFTMLVGAIAGGISALGYLYGNDWCKKHLNLHDTCGIQWLHGIPGIYGGIVSAICASSGYYNFGNTSQLALVFSDAFNRTMKQQAAYQLAGIAISIVLAIASGAIAGFIASRLLPAEHFFDDHDHFHDVVYGDDTKESHERGENLDKYDAAAPSPSKAIN
jgi:ammonium transporter Rh